jgi:hypothetical protein
MSDIQGCSLAVRKGLRRRVYLVWKSFLPEPCPMADVRWRWWLSEMSRSSGRRGVSLAELRDGAGKHSRRLDVM